MTFFAFCSTAMAICVLGIGAKVATVNKPLLRKSLQMHNGVSEEIFTSFHISASQWKKNNIDHKK